jgi:hypothetical protein
MHISFILQVDSLISSIAYISFIVLFGYLKLKERQKNFTMFWENQSQRVEFCTEGEAESYMLLNIIVIHIRCLWCFSSSSEANAKQFLS